MNPYAPPTEDRAPRMASDRSRPLAPGRFRSLRGFVWLNGVLLLACVCISIANVRNESRLDIFQFTQPDRALAAEILAEKRWLEALAVVFRSLTGLAFCGLLHRARNNLVALEVHGLHYSNFQTWISWFIPVVNLWRPYQIVREIWNASAPGDPAEAWRSEGRGGHGPVSLWWGGWMLNYVFTLLTLFDANGQINNGMRLTQVASAVDAGAGLFALLVVMGIAERQTARAVQAAEARAAGPAPVQPERPRGAERRRRPRHQR